jgi:hypothetical protein
MAAETEQRQPFRGVVRLTFEYERDRVRLIERQRVDMVAPVGESEPIKRGATGFWVELRDGRNRLLYQRVVYQPVRFEAEVFGEKPGDPLSWRPIANPRGTFALLVPDLPEANAVRLMSSPFEPERATEPARELLSIKLRGASGDKRARDR